MIPARIAAIAPIAAVLFVVATPSQAQEPEARERAMQLAHEALSHYDRGEMQAAVDLLLEAREAYPEPVLLYNLARAYEGVGRLEDAADAYEAYLSEAADIDERGAIVQHLSSLRAQLEERERLAAEREEARQAEREAQQRARLSADASSGPGAGPWIVGASGLSGLAAGIVLGALALSEEQEAFDSNVHATTVDHGDRAESLAIGANIGLAVGGALLAAGVVWLVIALLTDDSAEASP